jgi:hypothetical protein
MVWQAIAAPGSLPVADEHAQTTTQHLRRSEVDVISVRPLGRLMLTIGIVRLCVDAAPHRASLGMVRT